MSARRKPCIIYKSGLEHALFHRHLILGLLDINIYEASLQYRPSPSDFPALPRYTISAHPDITAPNLPHLFAPRNVVYNSNVHYYPCSAMKKHRFHIKSPHPPYSHTSDLDKKYPISRQSDICCDANAQFPAPTSTLEHSSTAPRAHC